MLQIGKLVLQAQARDMDPLQRQQRKPGSRQKQAALLQQQVGHRQHHRLCFIHTGCC